MLNHAFLNDMIGFWKKKKKKKRYDRMRRLFSLSIYLKNIKMSHQETMQLCVSFVSIYPSSTWNGWRRIINHASYNWGFLETSWGGWRESCLRDIYIYNKLYIQSQSENSLERCLNPIRVSVTYRICTLTLGFFHNYFI